MNELTTIDERVTEAVKAIEELEESFHNFSPMF